MTTIRNGSSLAALIAALGLLGPGSAQAARHHIMTTSSMGGGSASSALVLNKERLCTLILNKEAGSVAHQERYLGIESALLAKEAMLQQLVPQNAKQARLYHQQLTQVTNQANQIQRQLDIGKGRVLSQESQAINCLAMLSRLNVTNPALAAQLMNYLRLSALRQLLLSERISVIVNRRPATPIVPF